MLVLRVCLCRAGGTRKFSYKEKVVGLPVEESTMVDWCEEEYSSEEELDSDEAPLLEYPRRTRQKKDEAALERGLLVLHKLLIQFHL